MHYGYCFQQYQHAVSNHSTLSLNDNFQLLDNYIFFINKNDADGTIRYLSY